MAKKPIPAFLVRDGATLEVSLGDRVCAEVRKGKASASLALTGALGTVGEDGPPISRQALADFTAFALARGW